MTMELDFSEKRRFKRVNFREPVHFQFKDNNKFGGCLSSDISEGGIKLNVNDFVPVDAEMILQVKMVNEPKVVDLNGHVVWIQQVPYSDRYRIGLEFYQDNSLNKEEIQSYVKSHRF